MVGINFQLKKRLQGIYFYYFSSVYKEQYPGRVHVIEGNITDEKSFEKLKVIKAELFINCAANVKHFSEGTAIEDVNYHAIKNIIDYCLETDTRLVQVSTMSIGGLFLDEPGDDMTLKETELYKGQVSDSKYTTAKFMAEREILENVAENNLNAKIMRVGNLSARESDGEYQINFTTNTFMDRLKSIDMLGAYPYSMMDMNFEFSPIDYTAKAIVLLSQTPKENVVLHPFNNHTLLMNDLYHELESIRNPLTPVEDDVFDEILEEAQKDTKKAEQFSSFLAYQNSAHGRKIYPVNKSNNLTMQILYRLGFTWPITSKDYMNRFLNNLINFLYFDNF